MVMLALTTSALAQNCGDPDGNGTINVIDAANVARAAVTLSSACDGDSAACDANGDSAVNVIDAANVARAAVGLANVCQITGFLDDDGTDGVLGVGFAPVPEPNAPMTISGLQADSTVVVAGGTNRLVVTYDVGTAASAGSSNDLGLLLTLRNQVGALLEGFFTVPLDSPSGVVEIELGFAGTLGPGTFSLELATQNGGGVGQFASVAQMVSGGGPPPAGFGFGKTVCGSIDAFGELDTLTFSGSAQDPAVIRVVSAPFEINVSLEVFAPGAEPIAGSTGGPGVRLDLMLPTTGTYTLVISDRDGNNTGGYCVSLQRTRDPVAAAGTAYGQTFTSAIESVAEIAALTFAGAAGDLAIVRMVSAPFEINACADVYDPAGVRVDFACGGPGVRLDLTLPASGMYTILTSDRDGNNLGGYDLHLQRINDPAGAVAIVPGQTIATTIARPAELDAFTFAGSVGVQTIVRMVSVPFEINVCVELYDPARALVDFDCGGPESRLDEALSSAGTYTVLTSDRDGNNTGNYSLTLQQIP